MQLKRTLAFLLSLFAVSPAWAVNDLEITQTYDAATQITFFADTTFNPADDGTNYVTPTSTSSPDYTLSLTGLADATAQQSDKADLGEPRAPSYEVLGAFDYTGETPTSGTVDVYWCPSTSATAADGNVAGNSGIDALAPGGSVPTGLTDDEFVAMCTFVGSLSITDAGSVHNGFIGSLSPTSRYGQIVVFNNGGAAFEADNVEGHVVLNPITPQLQ